MATHRERGEGSAITGLVRGTPISVVRIKIKICGTTPEILNLGLHILEINFYLHKFGLYPIGTSHWIGVVRPSKGRQHRVFCIEITTIM